MADVSQTLTVSSGIDGRVKKYDATTPVRIAGIYFWERQSTANVIRAPHFESAANADGLVQPNKLRGLGDNKVSIRGYLNRHATDKTEGGTTALGNGVAVALDLMHSKTASTGYPNVVGFVSNFRVTCDINDKITEFSADVEVDGVFPLYGTVV
jgi:hypothetical protein